MRGVLQKIYIETRWTVAQFSLALFGVMFLLTRLLPKVLGDIDHVFERLPFVKPLVTALLGMDPGNRLSSEMMQAFLWVHPTVLSLIWAHELIFCSRVPAGEIDRGTADFLLGLPISRAKLYVAETIGWVLSGLVILSFGYLGHASASLSLPGDALPSHRATAYVMGNLFALYLAVGSFAFLVSSGSDRRGRAIGVVFAILLFSFLLNFLVQFWTPAKPFSFLGVLEYYRPAAIIRANAFPRRDVAVLVSIATVCWVTGGIVFRRRSICTV